MCEAEDYIIPNHVKELMQNIFSISENSNKNIPEILNNISADFYDKYVCSNILDGLCDNPFELMFTLINLFLKSGCELLDYHINYTRFRLQSFTIFFEYNNKGYYYCINNNLMDDDSITFNSRIIELPDVKYKELKEQSQKLSQLH